MLVYYSVRLVTWAVSRTVLKGHSRCVNFLPPPDDVSFLETAHSIYVKHQRWPEAIALAIRLGRPALIREDFDSPGNPYVPQTLLLQFVGTQTALGVSIMKRQLALILARAQTPLEWLQVSNEDGDTEELPEDIVECLSNSRLSTQFKEFGKELGVLEPKSLEDVYKSHLENARTTSNVDSARGNLASTFVNAFTNAGFGNDKLMVEAEEGNSWIYKNKDHGS